MRLAAGGYIVLVLSTLYCFHRTPSEIHIPTAKELSKLFSSGEGNLESILNDTAKFLAAQGKISGMAQSYSTAVNRTYLDAALLTPVTLSKLLRGEAHA